MLKKYRTTLILGITVFYSLTIFAADCSSKFWLNYQGIDVFKLDNTNGYYFITNHMAIDADGAPNAYHPDDSGLDYLANAGYPNSNWWHDILVVDPTDPSRAYQQKTGEFAGYFVSKTALQDRTFTQTDPNRYVDSRRIPYFVFPGKFYQLKDTGSLGDLGMAINLSSREKTGFVIADIGPKNALLGEVSINLAERLGGSNINPRTGAGVPNGKILYIIFPKSGQNYKWPLSIDALGNSVDQLLRQVGGSETILNCIKIGSPHIR